MAGPMRPAPGTCTASITPGREGDESPTLADCTVPFRGKEVPEWKEQFAGIGGIKDEKSQKKRSKRNRRFPQIALATSSILGTLDEVQARIIFSFQTILHLHTKS